MYLYARDNLAVVNIYIKDAVVTKIRRDQKVSFCLPGDAIQTFFYTYFMFHIYLIFFFQFYLFDYRCPSFGSLPIVEVFQAFVWGFRSLQYLKLVNTFFKYCLKNSSAHQVPSQDPSSQDTIQGVIILGTTVAIVQANLVKMVQLQLRKFDVI